MPTTTYVARDFNIDPQTFGYTGYGDIVGTNPWDSRDGDTSYGKVIYDLFYAEAVPELQTEITFRLEYESGPTPPDGVDLTLTFDVEFVVGSSVITLPFLFIATFATSHGGRTLVTLTDRPTTYTLYTDNVAAETGVGFGDDILEEFLDPGSDQYWRIFTSTLGGAEEGHLEARVTYLKAYLTWGVPPLRQRNRDDIRARLMPSRQRSIRARGYL